MTNQSMTGFVSDALPLAVQETPCCMCNCKGTLQAILHELRAMRRLMQTQKGQKMQPNTKCERETEMRGGEIKYSIFLSFSSVL